MLTQPDRIIACQPARSIPSSRLHSPSDSSHPSRPILLVPSTLSRPFFPFASSHPPLPSASSRPPRPIRLVPSSSSRPPCPVLIVPSSSSRPFLPSLSSQPPCSVHFSRPTLPLPAHVCLSYPSRLVRPLPFPFLVPLSRPPRHICRSRLPLPSAAPRNRCRMPLPTQYATTTARGEPQPQIAGIGQENHFYVGNGRIKIKNCTNILSEDIIFLNLD